MERDGKEKARGCKHCMGAFGLGPQPTSVVVLVLVFVLLLLVLNIMEVFMGGNGNTDNQQHHLAEADLCILIDVKVLHDFINGGLVFHMLQRKGQGEGKVLSSTAQASPRPRWDPHVCRVSNGQVL